MSKKRQKREYKRLEQVDHIKHRPDTFVGSIDELEQERIFVADLESESPMLKFKERILLSDALIRIFVEILSNAIDNIHRSIEDEVEMKKIKININRETNEISIWNDGSSIPIEIHKEEKKYIPHLIFGILQTSSNYDDNQERYTSGRNGFGAKLTNIFSKKFKVEIVDIDENDECTYYKQTWFNNMKECKKPKIVKVKHTTPFTKITWIADFDVFPGSEYNNRTLAMYYRLIYDAAMIAGSHKISIYLNDKKLPIKSLQDYTKLFGNCEEIIEINTNNSKVVITPSNVGFQNMAFTNGVFNSKGGVHVNVWSSCIFKPLLLKINKKGKPQLVIKDIQQFFRIFIKCDLINPKFKTQSKDYLASPTPEAKIDNKVIKSLMKWSFIDKVNEIIQGKELITLKRKEKKSKGFKAIPGYDPANNAGGIDSSKCTLIFTEGLSAKTYAVRGIAKGVGNLKGRDWFGVFPLRGKLLNVRNASTNDIAKNNEITNTINAIGLRYGVDYSKDTNYKKLNYGKICILCDADVDGIHIQGLLINVFHTLFPSLLEREESFIISMETPIVRIFKGSTTLIFYTEKELKDFLKIDQNKKYQRKYHKGLGTSSNKEVLETFGEKIIKYKKDEDTNDKMNMLFYNKNSNKRKKWLEAYNPEIVTSINNSKYIDMTYTKFIDERMINFSLDDCGRSIPHVLDGLKESQRKILFSVFLKNLNYKSKTLKVAQLAGYVAEKSAYHHGEQCLHDTIIKLANDIIGLNNIPLLFRDGQFATRLSGKDAAAGRYIFTKLDKLTRLLFPVSDDHLLPLNEEDGEKIEPKYYIPIIPMILANGCFAPETQIPLSSGGSKRADAIVLGDILIGDNGEPRTVQELFRGEDTMYTIKQKIGESYTVNSQHILTLKNTGDRSVFWYEPKKAWKIEWFDNETKSIRSKIFPVKQDADMKNILSVAKKYGETIEGDGVVEITVTDYLKLPKYVQKRLRGYKGTGVNWPYKSVVLDPYILGMWLGDGDSHGRGFSGADDALTLIWEEFAAAHNMEVIKDKNYSHSYHYYLRSKNENRHQKGEIYHPFKKLLNIYGMIENKHIPDDYIYNSKEVRLALLAGLIDTDGSVYHNGEQITISQCPKRKHILESAQLIARSLGFYTNIRSTTQTIKEKKYPQYALSISGIGLENIPTVLDRKKCSPRRDTQRDCSTTPIEVVEKGKGLYYGWSVDGNQRFVLQDFTCTHNCVAGIGTGWSCSVPCFNPEDLVKFCIAWMDNNFDDMEELIPWYRNFKGKIKKEKTNKYISYGVIVKSKGKVIVSELPIGVWTDKYKEFLEKLLEDKMIKSMKNYSTPQKVRFVITEHKNGMKCNKENMKLSSSISTSNIVLFLPCNKIHKFQTVKEIIEVFCKHRLELYEKRKVYLISHTRNSKEIAMNKKRFLEYVMDDKISVYRKSEEFIIEQLVDLEFLKIKKGKNTNYEYLLSMDMRSFTKEKIEKLNNEIEKLERLLENLQNITPKQMWKKELKEFTTEYLKWRKNN